MLLNDKFEIYPTDEQAITIERWISICRIQYYAALLDKQRIYKSETVITNERTCSSKHWIRK